MKRSAIRNTGKLLTLVILAVSASLSYAPEGMTRGGGGHGGGRGGCGHYCGHDHDGMGHEGEFGRGMGDHFGLDGRGALGGRLPVNHGYFNHMPYRYGWGGWGGGGYYGLGYSGYPNEFFPSYYSDGLGMGQQISSE